MNFRKKMFVTALLRYNAESQIRQHPEFLNLIPNLFRRKSYTSDNRSTRLMSNSPRSSRDVSGQNTTEDADSDLELDVTELKKNVSRMPLERYQQYHGHAPEIPYKDLIHRQQRYAFYGSASGEDPRLMWPNRSALHALEEEERKDAMGFLSERLNQVQVDKNAAQNELLERRKRIERNMAQMQKWIAEYKQKQAQMQREAKERAVKKEALLEEARDYFGYKIQANDPKFQQMVEEKEEKEKAEAKKRKKEEKAKKLAARIAQDMINVTKTEEKR